MEEQEYRLTLIGEKAQAFVAESTRRTAPTRPEKTTVVWTGSSA
jgi:hypothetical protein